MNQLAIIPPQELVRQSTDIANVCKEIVVASALDIQGRKYVRVEGWQSIATAHGCVASSKDVERVEGGFRAIGEVRRMADGQVIAQAEGFVGEDEAVWFGGEGEVWNRQTRQKEKKTLPKRPDYAIRAMAQTRAISRACRSAFAHVVVMMDAGLSTTPAEEVLDGGFQDHTHDDTPKNPYAGQFIITGHPIPKSFWGIKDWNTKQQTLRQIVQDETADVQTKKLDPNGNEIAKGDKETSGQWYIVIMCDEKHPPEHKSENPGLSSVTVPDDHKPLDPTKWREVTINTHRHPKGEPLGGMTLEELKQVRDVWWTKLIEKGEPTIAQKQIKAAAEFGIAELDDAPDMSPPAGAPEPKQEDSPRGEISIPDDATLDKMLYAQLVECLRGLCQAFIITEETFFEYAAKNQMLPKKIPGDDAFDIVSFEDSRLTPSWLKDFIRAFPTFMKAWGFKNEPPAEKPAKARRAKK